MAYDSTVHKKYRKMIYDIFENVTGGKMDGDSHNAIKKIMKEYVEEVAGVYKAELVKFQAILEGRRNARRKKSNRKHGVISTFKPKVDFSIKKEVIDNAEPNEKEQEEIVNEAVQETRKMTKEEIQAKLPNKTYL